MIERWWCERERGYWFFNSLISNPILVVLVVVIRKSRLSILYYQYRIANSSSSSSSLLSSGSIDENHNKNIKQTKMCFLLTIMMRCGGVFFLLLLWLYVGVCNLLPVLYVSIFRGGRFIILFVDKTNLFVVVNKNYVDKFLQYSTILLFFIFVSSIFVF